MPHPMPSPSLPGPRRPPLVNLIGLWKRPTAYLEWLRARYGKRVLMSLPFQGPLVLISEPADVKDILTAPPEAVHPGEGARILEPILGSYSVILLDEGAHLSQRKLMLPAFHGEKMQRLTGLMRDLAGRELDSWPVGRPFALHPHLQRLTLEIILRAVFGLTEGERIERLRGELRRLLDLLTRPLMLLAPVLMGPERLDRFGPFRALMRQVDALIHEEIAERRQAGDLAERSDIMSLLLQARDAETGAPMSDAELRDELLTLLVAGHETTANALAWAVERLARHPGKLARLKAEVSTGETSYMEAVVTETLRLRPVISLVARRLKQPVRIGEWLLPAGVTVAPSIYLMHRRPEIYPDPERFEPERFLEKGPGTYTWIPFGGGVRRCIGASFAQFEMAVVLAEIVRRWDIEPARPASERVFRRAITETPRHDAEVVLA